MMDLHCHSVYSDGSMRPEELAALAAEKGLDLVALTDHDGMDGQGEFLRAAAERGLDALTGLEVDARCDAASVDCEVHLLGYGYPPGDPGLVEGLKAQRQKRNARNRRILAQLAEAGYAIAIDRGEDEVVNRLHMADALVERGHAASIEDAFQRFLGPEGIAHLDVEKWHARDYIARLHVAGGLAVWAHPLQMKGDWRAVLEDLVAAGLDGVELYYPSHRAGDMVRMREAALDRGLLISTGSDYHGSYRPAVDMGMMAQMAQYDPALRESEQRFRRLAAR